jgi:hypothetical protein
VHRKMNTVMQSLWRCEAVVCVRLVLVLWMLYDWW